MKSKALFILTFSLIFGEIEGSGAVAAPIHGAVLGKVTDVDTGAPVKDVVVLASGPQGERGERTDQKGFFAFRELPIGPYSLRFQRQDVLLARDVLVSVDKIVRVDVVMPSKVATTQVTAENSSLGPMVDVGSSRVGMTMGSGIFSHLPLTGDVATLIEKTPGAFSDPVGLSLSGGTGAENSYFLEGMNVTALRDGTLGLNLRSLFLEEVEVVGAGFGAEYGQALGGVVNMALKSGGNDLRGSAFSWIEPGRMAGKRRFIRSDATVFSGRVENSYTTAFGAEVGGAILKNRLFFWAGYAPELGQSEFVRSADAFVDADGVEGIDRQANGDPVTRPLGVSRIGQESVTHHYAGKLTYKVADGHSVSVSLVGIDRNQTFLRGANMDVLAGLSKEEDGRHDLVARWQSAFWQRRLRVDASLGMHQETYRRKPGNSFAGTQNDVNWYSSPSLGQFDPALAGSCTSAEFDSCPVPGYQSGGYGILRDTDARRISGKIRGAAVFEAAGIHELKAGVEYDLNTYSDRRWVSGAPGSRGSILMDTDEFQVYSFFRSPLDPAELAALDPATLRDSPYYQDAIAAKTTAKNLGMFVQESYLPIPELTVNAGLRWEAQWLSDFQGNTRLAITDSFAPRLGAVYDFTRKGRGKLFAHYGQYYESIPMDLMNRGFGGEGVLRSVYSTATCPDPAAWRTCAASQSNVISGGSLRIAPGIKGSYNHEVVLGAHLQPFANTVLGAQVIYRTLGRIIEDSGGSWATGSGADLLSNPGGADGFPKPERTYKALQLTLHKRFARRWYFSGSYTYSRTMGNYSGMYSADSDQLDPNYSTQYDIKELLANRWGPLPTDRPHILRADGFRQVVFGRHTMTLGLGFLGRSGSPITPLGADQLLGMKEVFILPRGSAGRTPFVTQVDAHLAYRIAAREPFQVEAFLDIFNVLNAQTVLTMDAEYTYDSVAPAAKGTPLGKIQALDTDGTPLVDAAGDPVYALRNPNYLRPTSYQAPISGRVGVRVFF